ncbi:tyrosine-type recombinase/integrase [Aliarcobacter butzleri]|uniref:tyrosine-type recombinase/integrase n=1 Tax=Aliarcobacter butzleri TaxID=28197 RepID=UPI001EDA8AE0|nr:tyrosine-type recombinase/integrase [Aliarcobacter butzleri]MCG3686932.1 tyrosine-type recombinase/integrase [Aliarcobacter butzleri]
MKNQSIIEFEEFIKNFLLQLKMTNKSKNTISSYKNTLYAFLDYIVGIFEDFEIKNIKKSTILNFFEYKNEILQKQVEISPNTKKLLYTHLKTFFKYIEDENEDKLYDFSKIFDFKINIPKRIPKGLDESEKEKLLQYLENLNINSENIITYRNSLIIKMFFYCGLRKNEMINLKISDFIEEDETYVIYIIGKGDKEREVFIKKSIIDFELNELKEKMFRYICETSTGKLMDGSQVYRMIQSIYNKLNIKASVHDLRHTFAKTLSYQNVDITVIKELLGHSSIQTTAIYTNPSRKRIKSAIMEVF